MHHTKNIIKTILLSSLLLVFVNCFSQKTETSEQQINKELTNGKIDFENYIKEINYKNLSKSDTILDKGVKLDEKTINLLKLNSVDKSAKKFYFSRKIDISKSFLSIIISTEKKSQIDWYLINYDKDFKIIDSLLIFKNIDNVNYISSKITNDKVETLEVFVDQGQAITQGWEKKINKEGRFER